MPSDVQFVVKCTLQSVQIDSASLCPDQLLVENTKQKQEQTCEQQEFRLQVGFAQQTGQRADHYPGDMGGLQ